MVRATVEEIQEIFPDLGKVFIQACLDVYKGKKSRIVDALLTDNLHPVLLLMDRKMDKLLVYQDREAKLNAEYDGLQDDAQFKEQQIQRVQAMQADAEYNFRLKYGSAQQQLAGEYDDDYDDQYDDFKNSDTLKVEVEDELSTIMNAKALISAVNNSNNPSSNDTIKASSALSISNAPLQQQQQQQQQQQVNGTAARRERRAKNRAAAAGLSGGNTTANTSGTNNTLNREQIHQQMADMKRINAMTRDDEAEAAFWEQMRNNNRDQTKTSKRDHWKRELEEQDQELAEDDANKKDAAAADRGTSGPSSKSEIQGGTLRNAMAMAAARQQQQPQQQQQQQQQQRPSGGRDRGAKSAIEGNKSIDPDQKKKFRTKTHDKHHQRDKATRKMGQF